MRDCGEREREVYNVLRSAADERVDVFGDVGQLLAANQHTALLTEETASPEKGNIPF